MEKAQLSLETAESRANHLIELLPENCPKKTMKFYLWTNLEYLRPKTRARLRILRIKHIKNHTPGPRSLLSPYPEVFSPFSTFLALSLSSDWNDQLDMQYAKYSLVLKKNRLLRKFGLTLSPFDNNISRILSRLKDLKKCKLLNSCTLDVQHTIFDDENA